MNMPPIPGLGPPYALAFSDTAVGLLHHRGNRWQMIEQVALDDANFAAKTASLTRHLGARRQVTLWLPPGHVLSLRLTPNEARDVSAAIAARTGLDPAALATVVLPQPTTGDRIVFGVDRMTLGEAIAYARGWGFEPVAATVRPDSVPSGPSPQFAHPDLHKKPTRWIVTGAAGAVAAALLVTIFASWPGPPPSEAPRSLPAPSTLAAVTVHSDALPPQVPEPSLVQAAALNLPVADFQREEAAPGGPSVVGQPAAQPQSPALHLASIAPSQIIDAPMLAPAPGTAFVRRSTPAVPRAVSAASIGDRRAPRPALPDPAEDRSPAMGDGTGQGVDAVAAPAATQSEPASAPDQAEVAPLQPSETAPEAERVQPGAPLEVDPAEAARLAALAAVAPPPRPELPIVAGLSAPLPAARPRSIAAAARADREAQAARVAAASREASTPADRRQSGGPAPADVARAATVTAGLPAGETGLIGVFASGNDRTALLRLPDGRVTRVRRGDNVDGWTVSSIDDSTVRLTGRSGARTLRVPTR